MTQRSIPAAVQAQLEQSSTPDALLAFLTITHPALSAPIRVVSDVLNYVKGGNDYTGILFEFRVLSDDDSPPETELSVPNVDREIGLALRGSTERAQIALEICTSADFDLSVDPRTEIGTAAAVYAFQYYELADVIGDVTELRGRVTIRDFAQEPWPMISATQDRLPGLYR